MFNNTISLYGESQNYSHGYANTYNRTENIRYITRISNALRLATSLIRYLRTKITEINIINIDAFELLEINRYTKEKGGKFKGNCSATRISPFCFVLLQKILRV